MEAWEKVGEPAPGSNDFVMLQAEIPLTFAVPIAESLLGEDKNNQSITRALYPVMGALTEYAFQRFMDKPPHDFMPDTQDIGSDEWMQRASGTATGKMAFGYFGRHAKAINAIYELLNEEEKFTFMFQLDAMNTLGYGGSSVL